MFCPACSSTRRSHVVLNGREHPSVYRCGNCEAIFGSCYLGDSYALVIPRFAAEDVPSEQLRYFDFDTLGSAGVGRRHGWYDPATKLVHQVG